jgi:hypothetical protein
MTDTTTTDTTTTDTQGMSTADLAFGDAQGSAGSDVQQETVTTTESTSSNDAPLFESSDADSFRARWREVQAAFVDDPQAAVQQADGLVAETMKRLAQIFADERQGLESQWSSGGDVDTEALRVALQRYRSFFDRLLSV